MELTTPGCHSVMESFCPRVILSWSHSVLDSSQDKMDSREVLQSLDEMTPKEVLLSLDGTTPEESFSADETHPVESSCPQYDPRGVILSWNGTNPRESFCPGIERL